MTYMQKSSSSTSRIPTTTAENQSSVNIRIAMSRLDFRHCYASFDYLNGHKSQSNCGMVLKFSSNPILEN